MRLRLRLRRLLMLLRIMMPRMLRRLLLLSRGLAFRTEEEAAEEQG
jgi:hypothetical protein